MSYVKKYDVGGVRLDPGKTNYIYELPLLSLNTRNRNDVLSLVYHSGATNNQFHISNGFKLNIQKRIALNAEGNPDKFEEGNGRFTQLNKVQGQDKYLFDDDSQRILRRTGGGFTIEYSDYSKEMYGGDGQIQLSLDKYGEIVWSYNYSADKLISVNYGTTKKVKLNYQSATGNLESLQYIFDNRTICTTTFSYSSSTYFTIHHYTGVNYYISQSSGNFTVYSGNSDGSDSSGYSHRLTCSSGQSTITVQYKIGGVEVDSQVYEFVSMLDTGELIILDVTNRNGVKTRHQYENGKLRYSYEMTNPMFTNEDKYAGTVLDYGGSSGVSGEQTYNSGIPMVFFNHSEEWVYDVEAANMRESDYVTFSGWIKKNTEMLSEADRMNPNVQFRVADEDLIPGITFNVTNVPLDIWVYFSATVNGYQPKYSSVVCTSLSSAELSMKDFRITLQHGLEEVDDACNHITKVEDVLIYKDGSKADLPIYDATFTYGGNNVPSDGKVYFEDLLKYKINKLKASSYHELYYNRVKGILTAYDATAEVMVTNGTDAPIPLSNFYLARRSDTSRGKFTTKIIDNANGTLTYQVVDSNGTLISSQTLNNYFDVVSETADGVTTTYGRNDWQVTAVSVSGVGSKTTNYDYDINLNEIVTTVDEFGNSTVYRYEPVWGGLMSITLPDGTVINDEYDDDKFALLKRTFGNANGRSISCSYSEGNLSNVRTGNLFYDFTYLEDDLCTVSKNNTMIEEHFVGNTWSESYYPSYEDPNYAVSATFDKYGRPTSITGELSNTYDINPTFNNSTGALTAYGNNGSAHLATTTDELSAETSRFKYNNQGLLVEETVSNKNNFSDKKRKNEFTYDKIDRLKSHTCTYDVGNSKNVGGAITYVKGETDQAADNRISTYSYKANGLVKASTANTFDSLKRVRRKDVSLGQETFIRNFVYDKTRISSVTDAFWTGRYGTQNYGYDALGRIVSYDHSLLNSNSGNHVTYEYDQYGQLISENNEALDKKLVYEYNNIGNIIRVTESDLAPCPSHCDCYTQKTFVYSSTHPDRLINFDGNPISYDALGYPISYKGKNYSWTKGKLSRIYRGSLMELDSVLENCNFVYNGYGQRTAKTYTYDPNPGSAVDYSYIYDTQYNYDYSGRLIREHCTERDNVGNITTRELIYLYDESSMIGVMYNYNGQGAESYYYHRNLQGDVIAIYNANGGRVVEYAYDAFGNCTVIYAGNADLANTNPIRYRGYYYDRETGLYYLNARYYNPEWRRFMSPDDTAYLDPESVNGLNLYAYCGNDPVNYADPSGHNPDSVWKTVLGVVIAVGLAALAIGATIVTGGSFAALAVGFGMGAAASLVGQGVGNVLNGENFFHDISISSIIMGGLAGAAFATGIGGFWGGVGIGAASNAGTAALENKSWMNIIGSAVVGGMAAGVGYGIGRFIANNVFKNGGMMFGDYFDLARMDAGLVRAGYLALRSSWYTFLPSIFTASSRALIKYFGNKRVGELQ